MRSKSASVLLAVLLFAPWGKARALVLDAYSSTFTMTISTDAGSTALLQSVAGTEGNAVEMLYNIDTGNFAQFIKDYSQINLAAEGGNALRFRYKATGNSNTLEIKFTDSDSTRTAVSDKLDLKLLTRTDGVWREMTVYFSSFTTFPDGNSSFDLSRVQSLTVGVTADNSTRGSGSIWLDKFEAYKSTFTLADDFEDLSDPNFFGGNAEAFASTNGSATVTYVTLGKERALQLQYSVLNGGDFSGLTMGLGNRNFQGHTHLSFKVRGNAGGEFLKVGLEGTGTQAKVVISSALTGGITTAFQRVTVPMSSFTAVDISSVAKFSITAENAIGSGAGTVWIDDVAFTREGETPGATRVLDDFDLDRPRTNWDIYRHDDASLAVSVVSDATVPDSLSTNRVYRLDYTFTASPSLPAETPWAVIDRPFQLSIAPFDALRFRYRGSGSNNNFEFKLTDDDNTTWFRKFLMATNTSSVWRTVTVPFSKLSFFSSGTDDILNLKRIKQIAFAVAKGSGGGGGFAVDQLETPEDGDTAIAESGRLISSVKVVNNPFSPNGDGVKDQAFFVYSLDGAGKVNLKIYSLEGDEVRALAFQDQSSGVQSLEWNGRDNDNRLVRNGLYLFRLEASALDGRTDEYKQVIAVLR
ncbi:MAG: hypothetical protein A2636_04590 [Elusimicrobia bacterium RIFCSPHIGHO2_01_FULL_64_10]|nr:MAG: hypothetical protein A2636_04590 [Elusimicrobia bacterium RIFCSPHIGHO2_01_FULL_64_10]